MSTKETKTKILCVEDEQDLRENITTILQQEGYDTIEASDGKEAYEKFAIYKPHLVLCDINMPIMNGYELLKKIHNESSLTLNATPFIFLTALGQKHNYLKGVKLGADEYIVKPIDFDILLSTIKAKLNKAKDQKNDTNNKLIEICSQISDLIPKKIQDPLQNIITLSVTLKKEIPKLNIEQRYIEYINKIYLSSLTLNAQIIKAFDKGKIIDMVNSLGKYTDIKKLVSQIKKEVSNQKLTLNVQSNLPKLSIETEKFIPAIASYLTQSNIAKSETIKIDIFQDYVNNLIFSISGHNLLPASSKELEDIVTHCNGSFHIQNNDGITYHIITFPNFLLKTFKDK